MYVLRNIEARSRNHYCSGKSIIIIYSVCIFEASSIQHAMCLHHIVICAVSASAIVFHVISNDTILGGGGAFIEHKMCVLIISTTFV